MARILLLDDDIAEITAVKRVLARGPHRTQLATTAADAAGALERAAPDLFVVASDCDDGRALALARRASASVPVLVLGDVPALPRAIRTVAQPVVPEQLAGAIEALLDPTARASAPPATPAPAAAMSAAPRVRNAAEALRARAEELRAGGAADVPSAAPAQVDPGRALDALLGEPAGTAAGEDPRSWALDLSGSSEPRGGRVGPERPARDLEARRSAAEQRVAAEPSATAEKQAVEQKAAEQRAAADRKAADERRAAAEAKAAAERRAADEVKAAAEQRAAAERKAADERRAAVEARADDERRAAAEVKAAAERKAAVEQRTAADRKAADERRAAADRKAAAERRAAAEARAAVEQRTAADRKAADERAPPAERSDAIDQGAAAAPVSGHAASAPMSGADPLARAPRPRAPARPPAPALPRPPAELQAGTLADVSAPRLLALAARARLAGRVDFEGEATRTLWFEAGRVVGARSAEPGERLEALALRLGLVTRDQHQLVSTEAAALPSRRAALLLLDSGFLKPAELSGLARRTTEEVVFGVFGDAGARFQWVSEQVPADERSPVERPPLALAMEAVRRRWGAAQVEAILGGPDTLLAPAPDGPPVETLALSPEERRAGALADGLRTLDEILRASPLDPLPARQVLAALVETGALAVRRLAAPSGPEAARAIDLARVEDRLDQARRADYFTVLGLPRTSTPHEVLEAADRLEAELDPGRHDGATDEALAARLAEIRQVLRDAREVLGDDRLRQAYLAGLGS